MPRSELRDNPLTIYITSTLKAELEAEARDSERTLSSYVAMLLEQRGKWSRAPESKAKS